MAEALLVLDKLGRVILEAGSVRKITRRQFLNRSIHLGRTLSAVVAVPYIVPSSVLGKDGSVAPSERITMGGIGFGGQGTRDMRNFMTCADVQFIAVCDVDTERRNKAKAVVDENYGNRDCAAYNDFRELLGRDDIDAVLSATGDRWHALTSIYAAKAVASMISGFRTNSLSRVL